MQKFIITILTTLTFFGTCAAQAKVLNSNNPPQYQQFRLDYLEMVDIANPNRLSWRIFYDKPSEGPDAAWFDAIKQGDLETVISMVEAGQNIEVKDDASLGQTALGWAAFIGYEDIVKYLVEQGADLWATDKGDVTNALKSAGLGKNIDVFKFIYEQLKDDININDQAADSQGETILIVASSNGRKEIVQFLLSLGANPNLVTTIQNPEDPAYDQDALTFACQRGNTEVVEILINHHAINHRTGKPSCDE